MILFLSGAFEPNVNNVIELLDAQAVDWIRINGVDLLQKVSFDIAISSCEMSTTLHRHVSEKQSIDLSKVTAVWNRRLGPMMIDPSLETNVHNFINVEMKAITDALEFLTPTARWMNPYWADLTAENPLRQLLAAKQAGLMIPATLVTQSAEAAKRFVEKHQGRVVLKMLSNVNPASLGIRKFFLTNRWSESVEQQLTHIQYCPTLLQAEVEKLTEIRVTVVGKLIFAVAISPHSLLDLGVDIREGNLAELPHAEYLLPLEIQQKILLMLNSLSLHFCTMDLIKTIEGEYVFLDLNPCGQYGWTETMTTLQINQAIANWLTNNH